MTNKWTKIVPLMPKQDPGFLTCGGVTQLNTRDYEKELDCPSPHGTKVGEAGSDEQQYGGVS